MKAVIIFAGILLICVIIGGLVGGFVYGIVKRGRELKRAQVVLYQINQQCNLWNEDVSPIAEGVRMKLNTYYDKRSRIE